MARFERNPDPPVTKGKARKAAVDSKKTLRQGKRGRPLAPSGPLRTAKWNRKGGKR